MFLINGISSPSNQTSHYIVFSLYVLVVMVFVIWVVSVHCNQGSRWKPLLFNHELRGFNHNYWCWRTKIQAFQEKKKKKFISKLSDNH